MGEIALAVSADETTITIQLTRASQPPTRETELCSAVTISYDASGEPVSGTITDADGTEHDWMRVGSDVFYDGELFGARPSDELDRQLYSFLFGASGESARLRAIKRRARQLV